MGSSLGLWLAALPCRIRVTSLSSLSTCTIANHSKKQKVVWSSVKPSQNITNDDRRSLVYSPSCQWARCSECAGTADGFTANRTKLHKRAPSVGRLRPTTRQPRSATAQGPDFGFCGTASDGTLSAVSNVRPRQGHSGIILGHHLRRHVVGRQHLRPRRGHVRQHPQGAADRRAAQHHRGAGAQPCSGRCCADARAHLLEGTMCKTLVGRALCTLYAS